MMDKFYFIVAMVVAFYISINSIQNVKFQNEALEGLIKEYNSGFIDNMIVLRNSTNCPKDYNSLIYNYNWPGNHRGCGCKKDSKDSNYHFYRNSCPNLSSNNCKYVEETEEILLNKWKGSLICYRRNKIIYDDLNLIKNNEKDIERCDPETHKICGIIDGKDNLLCLDNEKSCPLTEIKLLKKNELNEFFNRINITDYENVIINLFTSSSESMIKSENKTFSYLYELIDDTYLYVSNSPNKVNKEQLLSFFRIDITKPCLNPIRSPSSENFFPLMKNKFDLMCDKSENGTELTDNTFSSIDSIKLEDYYKDNNVLPIVKKTLDPFNIDISYDNLNIYARTYPGWSIDCQITNPKALHSFTKTAEVMNSMLISVIIHSFISIALIISIGVFSCFLSQYFELLFKAVDLGFIILNLIYPIQIISTCNWVINILTDENGSYCGDETVNLILAEISAACMQLEYAYIMILLLAILSCIIFIYVLYYWVRPAAKEVNETLISLRQKL
jgi:hypothetical protein